MAGLRFVSGLVTGYRISKGVIDNPDPTEAARLVAQAGTRRKVTSRPTRTRIRAFLGGGLDRKRAAASLAETEPVSCLVA